MRSGTLILGPYTREFEEAFAKYIGVTHAVAVKTGTSALEVLLAAHDAEGKRVASNTNFASVAAIVRTGGEPVFMDMTQEYFVMWVHIGGIIAPDFPKIVDYCRSKKLFLIEDAAHAHAAPSRA